MTQLTRDANGKILEIPPSITTLEQLVSWGIENLQYLYPDLTSVEALDSNGDPIKFRCVESHKLFITATGTGVRRHIGRISFEMKPDYTITGKAWNNVKILGDATIPVGGTT